MKNVVLRIMFLGCLFCLGPALLAVEGPKYACAIADYKKGEVCMIAKTGEITARYKVNRPNDVWVLPDGSLAYSHYSGMKVHDASGRTVFAWQAGRKDKDEIHAIQPLPDGAYLVARNGLSCLVELNKEGQITKTIPVPSQDPSTHGRYRMCRKLVNGNYLIALKRDKEIREVDAKGTVIRSFSTKDHAPVGLVRLPNGNTLYSAKGTAATSAIIEIDSQGALVWSVTLRELSGTNLKSVIGLQRLKNGNTVLAGYHGEPHIVEITPDKHVVWKWTVPEQMTVTSIHVYEDEGDCTKGEVLK